MIKNILLTIFLLTGVISAESSIGLDINSEDVELLGAINLNSTIGYTGGTSYLVDASYLHNEDNDLFTIGLSGENSLEAAPGLIFGFGFKAAFAEDFMALPLMAKAIYALPFNDSFYAGMKLSF